MRARSACELIPCRIIDSLDVIPLRQCVADNAYAGGTCGDYIACAGVCVGGCAVTCAAYFGDAAIAAVACGGAALSAGAICSAAGSALCPVALVCCRVPPGSASAPAMLLALAPPSLGLAGALFTPIPKPEV